MSEYLSAAKVARSNGQSCVSALLYPEGGQQ
jgi:hypothetical protein